MANQFNVPPVIFPSDVNSVIQLRCAPAAPPFSPPITSDSGLPLVSFDISSSTGFEAEPPLLEELGINTNKIYQKTLSILNPFQIKSNFNDDGGDLSGPFLYLMVFGLLQLLAGKMHFGIILGWVVMASVLLYVVFNMLAGRNGNLDLYTCVSLVGYCMLPIVMLSALSLFLPGGLVIKVLAGVFVVWSTRVCTRLLVELASYGVFWKL